MDGLTRAQRFNDIHVFGTTAPVPCVAGEAKGLESTGPRAVERACHPEAQLGLVVNVTAGRGRPHVAGVREFATLRNSDSLRPLADME